jgi:hypothetical protein
MTSNRDILGPRPSRCDDPIAYLSVSVGVHSLVTRVLLYRSVLISFLERPCNLRIRSQDHRDDPQIIYQPTHKYV